MTTASRWPLRFSLRDHPRFATFERGPTNRFSSFQHTRTHYYIYRKNERLFSFERTKFTLIFGSFKIVRSRILISRYDIDDHRIYNKETPPSTRIHRQHPGAHCVRRDHSSSREREEPYEAMGYDRLRSLPNNHEA